MGVVTIRIPEMQGLVDAMLRALKTADDSASRLQKRLRSVDLDCSWLSACLASGDAYAQLSEAIDDAERRLGMARMIDAMAPSFDQTQVFDESFVEQLPQSFVFSPPDQDVIDMLVDKFTAAGPDMDEEKIKECAAQIATMVANTVEPYKSLFLNALPTLNFSDRPNNDWAMTNPVTGTIHIDLDAMLSDQPCPYYTFFHEIGHRIDGAGHGIGWDSTSFRFGPDGQPLDSLMRQDLVAYLSGIIDTIMPSIDPDQKERVVYAMAEMTPFGLSGWLPDDNGLPLPEGTTDDNGLPYPNTIEGSDAWVYQKLKDSVFADLHSNQTRTASDIVGGLTSNTVGGDPGHPTVYWDAPILVAPPTGEFWAGWFADNMTFTYQLGDLAAPTVMPWGYGTAARPKETRMPSLDATKSVFPSATEALDSLAEKLWRMGR